MSQLSNVNWPAIMEAYKNLQVCTFREAFSVRSLTTASFNTSAWLFTYQFKMYFKHILLYACTSSASLVTIQLLQGFTPITCAHRFNSVPVQRHIKNILDVIKVT